MESHACWLQKLLACMIVHLLYYVMNMAPHTHHVSYIFMDKWICTWITMFPSASFLYVMLIQICLHSIMQIAYKVRLYMEVTSTYCDIEWLLYSLVPSLSRLTRPNVIRWTWELSCHIMIVALGQHVVRWVGQ